MYKITSAAITNIGKVRKVNEDAVLEAGNLFAVADGMGGHQAGDVASSLALSAVEQYVEDNIGVISGERLVEKAVEHANSVVHSRAESSPRYSDMGTTLTLLYREGEDLYTAHVGDSRAYLYREGYLRQLTSDDSLVAALVREGEITSEEARRHPQRNIILKALGLEPEIEVEVSAVKLQPGDRFLLATDGLTSLVEDEEIRDVLQREGEPESAARLLVRKALDSGGNDNVSVVVVSFAESQTFVPVGGPAPERQAAEGERGRYQPGAGRKARGWLIALLVAVMVLGAGFGIGFYFFNHTFFIGVKDGRVALYRGFPFWNLSVVEQQYEIEAEFLPEPLRERVSNRLEPESREEAERTIETLRREAEENSSVVPRVEGMKYEEAREALEERGLKVEVELVSNPAMPPDVVILQEPEPYDRVGRGTTVRLKVVMSVSPEKGV